MKPKNEKEINNAFFQFLIMFLVTVFIVVIAVFIDYSFPWKDYKTLHNEYYELKAQAKGSGNVNAVIDSLNSWFLVYGKPGRVQSAIEADIAEHITRLKNTSGDSASIKFYKKIAIGYSALLEAKKNELTITNQYNALVLENNRCNKELENAKKDLEKYQLILSAPRN
jgi:hypothetical protein